jgi:hypothetical protein
MMPYRSQLWNEEAAMDKWYPEAIAAQELEEAKRIAAPCIKYATEPVFARGSTGIQSTSFYSKSLQHSAPFTLLIFTDNQKLATGNKHESRVSTDKPLPPLPALPKTDDAYFEYMFSDAMDGETIHEDEEVEIAGLEYESRKCQLLSHQF